MAADHNKRSWTKKKEQGVDKKSEGLYVECILPRPLDKFYTYEFNRETKSWDGRSSPLFKRVWVNFNNRKEWALVVKVSREVPSFECKGVLQVIDKEEIVFDHYIDFLNQISNFYLCYLGDALSMALPSGKKIPKDKTGNVTPPENEKNNPNSLINKNGSIKLTGAQASVLSGLKSRLAKCLGENQVIIELIYGITGSGKTEIYFLLIEKLLALGREAILLVPEIGLSVQLLDRIRARFGRDVALYHSRLKASERLTEWFRVRNGDVKIAVGTRSAVFLPFRNLGLVVMDEEHEAVYKEHSTPRYHARQVAQMALKKSGGMILLGSATPSIETYYWAKSGKIGLSHLPERVTPNPVAKVCLLDISQKRGSSMLSVKMAEEMEKTLKAGNQIILLLNRRGFSPVVRCYSCKHIVICPNCEISLSLHKKMASSTPPKKGSKNINPNGPKKEKWAVLKCHYCGYKQNLPDRCPACNSDAIGWQGSGIQQVEDEINLIFNNYKIERLDADSIQSKSFEESLRAFEKGKIDILLGTQMIAKGIDIPNVTFVGVVMADIGLYIPDFRANERTFSLLTQVAGRSGRGDDPGQVIIQTLQKDHSVMKYAMEQDFQGFYREEIVQRQKLAYPPFSRLLRVVIRGKIEEKVVEDSALFFSKLKEKYESDKDSGRDIPILGPVPAPFYKINNNYRYHILIKESSLKRGLKLIQESLNDVRRSRFVYREIDIDPVDLL